MSALPAGSDRFGFGGHLHVLAFSDGQKAIPRLIPAVGEFLKKQKRQLGLRVSKPLRQRALLEALEEHLTLEAAARACDIDRKTVYNWRKADPKFDRAVSSAQDVALDQLEGKAFEVAMNREGRYYEKDASLNRFFLLKGYRPQFKDAWRPEVDAPPMTITFNLPPREGMRTALLPEHFIEGQVVDETA